MRATHRIQCAGAGFCCVSLFGTGVGALPYGHPRWLPPTTYTRPGGGGSRTRVPLQLKPNRPARPHYPLPLGTPHGTPLAGRELHTRCGGTSTPHAPTPSHQRARPPAAARPAQAQPKALCWLMPCARKHLLARWPIGGTPAAGHVPPDLAGRLLPYSIVEGARDCTAPPPLHLMPL